MNLLQRVFSQSWIIVLLIALGVLGWSTSQRIDRIRFVSGLARASAPGLAYAAPDRARASNHQLIIAERNEASIHLLLQLQEMRDRGEWRLRHVGYDNAPDGRVVRSSSAYRWWAAFVARVDQAIAGVAARVAVERVALWADPLIQAGLLLLGTTIVASSLGGAAASIFAIGVVLWFPFAASFVPGAPDARALARAFGIGSVLLIVAGLWSQRRSSVWWIAAGVCGAACLWVDVATGVPIIGGIGIGGTLVSLAFRRLTTAEAEDVPSPSWRAFSISGALTVLVLYLVEFAPDRLGEWSLDAVHPLYALAWIGMGEWLTLLTSWACRRAAGSRAVALGVVALLPIALIPVAVYWSGSPGYTSTDLASFRLTQQPGAIVAQTFWAWLKRDGLSSTCLATLLPLLLLAPAGMLALRPSLSLRTRRAVAFLAGPIAVVLAVALRQLSGWSLLGSMLLVLACVVVASSRLVSRRMTWISLTVVAVITILSLPPAWVSRFESQNLVLTSAEAEELIERDLSQWMAARSIDSRPIVFAPPRQSLSFAYFGGLRGIGTFAAENRSGFGTTLTLTGVKSMEEVQGLIEARGIRFVVVPSWDPFFDEFAGRYLTESLSERKSFFVSELRRFNLPNWLRPLSYPMPVMQGFEAQSALVFEVVEPQSPSVAASRLAEYFSETGDLSRAVLSMESLRRFPGDIGALAAQAQVLKARDDMVGLSAVLEGISARLSNGADRFLPWDRRVSLAVVLAHGGRLEATREQTSRCISDATDARLRSLSGDALYGLLVLSDTFRLPFADPSLRAAALSLLPEELRRRL